MVDTSLFHKPDTVKFPDMVAPQKDTSLTADTFIANYDLTALLGHLDLLNRAYIAASALP